MEMTITIPDAQWQKFQHLAQETVETKWNGNYEDFATYIMMVNLENYIESQKRKHGPCSQGSARHHHKEDRIDCIALGVLLAMCHFLFWNHIQEVASRLVIVMKQPAEPIGSILHPRCASRGW